MIRWIPYTFVRTVIFFILGIVLGFFYPDLLGEAAAVVLVGLLTSVYVVMVFFFARFRREINPGFVALPLVFLFGYFHTISRTESRHGDHLVNGSGAISAYTATVMGYPEERAKTWKVKARIATVFTGTWEERKGNIVLHLDKHAYEQPFHYGDVLLIKGTPQVPEVPANPGEFDYKAYLRLSNIYHQHFLRAGDVLRLNYSPPSHIVSFAFKGRAWAEATLAKYVHGDRELAIASALVLGVTDGLDNELLSAYSSTGSMHILAVSGLHITIIYIILLWFLSPLKKVRGGRWIIAITSLLILWLYAFVTGLTPSVLRAVTMFSFLAIARPWSKSANIYNTLAVSAFFLLVFDPFLIFSVGFQLSYVAVLGIVYLHPRLIMLWQPENLFMVEIWKMTAVAVAAQIATFPLGLYYFHQFPNYFLISNLIVVPLSFVVLILGLLILAVSFAPLAAAAVGFCLKYVIVFLNTVVFWLDGIPFSSIQNIHISVWQCGLLFLIIAFVLYLFEYRKFVYVGCCAITVAVYAGLQWSHFATEVNIRKVAVYKVPGHTAVDLIDRGQAFFISDTVMNAEDKIRFHISPHRIQAGVSGVVRGAPVAYHFKGCTMIVWGGRRLLHITETDFELPSGLSADWVLVANNAVTSVKTIAEALRRTKTVILDSSNSFFFASRFLEDAKLYKLDVHSVLHQGAYVQTVENEDT